MDKLTLPFRLTREQRELRRLASARDLAAGMRGADVARKCGVGRASANRWNRALRRDPFGNYKKAAAGATVAYVDGSGVRSTPFVGKTWAPVGQTPVFVHRDPVGAL